MVSFTVDVKLTSEQVESLRKMVKESTLSKEELMKQIELFLLECELKNP